MANSYTSRGTPMDVSGTGQPLLNTPQTRMGQFTNPFAQPGQAYDLSSANIGTDMARTGIMAGLTAAAPVIGLGVNILSLLGSTYNNYVARKEAKEQQAQARKDYERALAQQLAQYKDEQEKWQKTYNLDQNKWLQSVKSFNENNKRYWDQTNYTRHQEYMDRWLGMLNDPNAKANYLAVMKGGR